MLCLFVLIRRPDSSKRAHWLRKLGTRGMSHPFQCAPPSLEMEDPHMFSELPVLIYSLGKHNILLAYTKSGTQNSKILGE